MKKITYIFLILAALIFSGCEKVVDVNLNTAPPRLVIDASINWIKGTSGSTQKIKLSTTGDYFGSSVPPVSNATVFITDSNQTVYNFTELVIPGEYVCNNFVPVIGATYMLTVVYKGETYTATETMTSVPPIDKIEQTDNGGFSGKDIQIKAYFTDNGATTDYYLFKFLASIKPLPEYGVIDDTNFNGNQVFGIYSDEKLKAGDTLNITFSGVSKRYFNYMQKIIGIANGSGGGPFQAPPATVRGNIINTNNDANYPFGYFNLSETDQQEYTVQ